MLAVLVVAEVGLQDGIDSADVMLFLGGAISVLTLLGLIRGLPVVSRICAFFRWWESFRDYWDGSPAAPGSDRIPGFPERLNRIDGELTRNGGSTMKDAVFDTKRLAEGLQVETARVAAELKQTTATLSARLDHDDQMRIGILEVTTRNAEATREAFLVAGFTPPEYVTIPIATTTVVTTTAHHQKEEKHE